MAYDPHVLPPDLPQPVDDGAADHLPGAAIPALSLPDSDGTPFDLREAATGTLVLFVYPRTGTPGLPLPAGWDEIPGARGCTPQSCGFRDRHGELVELGATVCGMSAQPLAEQREFALRERIPYRLLNDSELSLAGELGLPVFEVEGMRLYRRLTIVAAAGRIEKVFYPVFPPDRNASDVLAWLRRDRSPDGP